MVTKHVCQELEFVAESDDICPACQHRAAVLAERERAAKIAEATRRVMPLRGESIDETVSFVQRCIAAAIRQPPGESE